MKTKLTRLTKRSIAIVLTILMMFSMLIVGTVTASALNCTGGTVYFDASGWNTSSNSTVQIVIGHSGYSSTYTMTRIGNTNLYRYAMPNWDGATYLAFIATSGKWSDGSWGSGNVSNAGCYTATFSYDLYSGSTYLFTKSSGSNGASVTGNYLSSFSYSNLNYTQTTTVQVSTNNGSSYSTASTSPATINISTYRLSSATAATSSTGSIALNSSSTTNTSVTAAQGSDVTYSVSNVNSDYTFKGWYTDSGTQLSTSTTYTRPGTDINGAKTVYARFVKAAEINYYVRGDFAAGQWDVSSTNAKDKMTNSSGTYSVSYSNISSENHQFKITTVGNWDEGANINNATIDYSTGISKGTSSDGNIAFIPDNDGATVTITFTPSTSKVTISATGGTPPKMHYFVSGINKPIGTDSTDTSSWSPALTNHELTETTTGSGVYSKTYTNVPVGTYSFQINGSTKYDWGTIWRNDGSTTMVYEPSSINAQSSSHQNAAFKLEKAATSVTIKFEPSYNNNKGRITVTAVLPDDEYYISGEKAPIGYSGSGNNWQPNAQKMDKSGNVYSYSYGSVAAGEYEFKITKDGTWDTQFGGDHIGTITGTGGQLVSVSGTGGNAAKLILDPSKYTTYSVVIKFDTSTSKINVEIKGLTEAEEEHFVVGTSVTSNGYIGGGDWENPRPDGHKMTKSTTNSKEFSIKYTNVPADTYKFQITDGYYGADHPAYKADNATTVYTPSLINDEGYGGDNTNAIFTLSRKATSVIITFNTSTKTITVTVEFPEDEVYVFGEPKGESSWSENNIQKLTLSGNNLYYYEYQNNDVNASVKYRIKYNEKYYATINETADIAVSQNKDRPDSTYMKNSASEGWSFTFNPNGARYRIWVDVSNIDKYGNGVKTWVEIIYYDAEVDITYYVDMHGNTNAPTIVVTDKNGATALRTTTLPKVDSKTSTSIYGATITTPYLKSDTDIYIKIKSGSYESGVFTIDRSKATAANAELWFEAVNEEETSFVRRESTTKVGGVASTRTRIYLKKPNNMNNSGGWNSIGIYTWRNSDEKREFDWYNTPVMKYMGQDSSGYKYYYYDILSEADHIIFQGLTSDTDTNREGIPQTENLQRGTNNVYTLNTDGATAIANTSATAPSASRYVGSLTMNNGSEGSIAPTAGNYAGTAVTYSVPSAYTSYVSVNSSGVVKALKSTQQLSGKAAQVQINIKGNFDSLLTAENKGLDVITITVSITIFDSSQINEFSLMSYSSQETEVTAGTGGEIQSIDKVVGTGFKKGTAYTATHSGTAIVTQSGKVFTVKYAKPEGSYANLKITFETTSIPTQSSSGRRYGFKEWQQNNVTHAKYTADGKANTAVAEELEKRTTVTPNMAADGSTLTAIYEEYSYTDLHIVYNYYEYKIERTVDGVKDYYYFYDPEFAGNEDESNPNFANSHILKTYEKVTEIRETVNAIDTAKIKAEVEKNGIDIRNNYYDYTLGQIGTASKSGYDLTVTVRLNQTPRTYKVIVSNSTGKQEFTEAEDGGPIYYQSYIDINSTDVTQKSQNLEWRAIEKDSPNTDTTKFPLLARGLNYRFRVTDNTTIVVYPNADAGENPKKQSTVTYSGYEITYENNVEKLVQNFYIADFFSRDMVTKTDADGERVMDDVTFVGGGVIYYSVDKDGNPLKNTVVNSGYVGEDGVAVADEIKGVVQDAIENNSATSGYSGSIDPTKVAYSTEIGAQTYKDALGASTGLVLRYLPYEILNYADGSYAKQDQAYRYSNALGAYQYVYSAKSENKASNEGKYMRLYSFYIYSYTDYDEDDKAVTVYDVVLSENYADAETYLPNNQ